VCPRERTAGSVHLQKTLKSKLIEYNQNKQKKPKKNGRRKESTRENFQQGNAKKKGEKRTSGLGPHGPSASKFENINENWEKGPGLPVP